MRALYELHPDTRDLLVEGPSDLRAIRGLLREGGFAHVIVSVAHERVEIDVPRIREYWPDEGAKGLCIAVACLAAGWSLPEPSVTCLIDRDFEILGDCIPLTPALVKTDFPAMECYFLDEARLQQTLGGISTREVSFADVMESLGYLWMQLFAMRWIVHRMVPGVGFPAKAHTRCRKVGSRWELDGPRLLGTLAGVPRDQVPDLVAKWELAIAKLGQPGPHATHGHDIAPWLRKTLSFVSAVSSAPTLETLMLGTLRWSDLASTEMLASLKSRLAPAG